MNLLALDTSTLSLSVAICRDGHDPIERTFRTHRGHSPRLLSTVAELLGEASLTAQDIDLIAVGLGPGSFTGLRIGLACAKGLCFANECEVIGVGSLEAIALGARTRGEETLVTAVDARKSEVYAAAWRFDSNGEPVAVIEPGAFGPALLAERLAELDGPLVGAGNGFALYADTLQNGASGLVILPEAVWWPRATSVAQLGRRRYEQAGADALDSIEPRYIRASDAELNWGRKQR
jgi:tRNA threonylcarbamoyladenosine biosynthesis protein TsaB